MTEITFHAIAVNSAGLEARVDSSFEMVGEPTPILPPVIDSVVISPMSGPRGTLFTITVTAHDPNTPQLELGYLGSLQLFANGNLIGAAVAVNTVPNTALVSPVIYKWQS